MSLLNLSVRRQHVFFVWVYLILVSGGCSRTEPRSSRLTLEETLLKESAESLAHAARLTGDAKRGASLFHSPAIVCSKCHQTGSDSLRPSVLGPDLTQFAEPISDEEIVKAVLTPSSSIRKGWEPEVVATQSGKTFSGLIVEENDQILALRDPLTGQVNRISLSDVVERKKGDVSTMPSGQVNLLEGRQEFLDLIRYLIEIRDGGETRARELQPALD